ncbi:MAG: tRNA (adenosine(37)-N6)-threonylcarbamoyltransferase complex ATPase subunit type 1 TsaE [Bacillota bacterium]|nr:tRNA (adenosine(37)-N6)-threonylcarbamoyltransferase complex ATPase subunit type 1 TsaE [Bacillota bacterium]
MKTIKVNSLEEMKILGNKIGSVLKGGETICLQGDLGAGKTHLTKFIGQAMGIEDYITSPSFAILNIYYGKINLNHFDSYRLEQGVDFDDLGFDEYLFSQDVNIIEWPERMEEILPKDRLNISINKLTDTSRELTFSTNSYDKYKHILEII